MPESGNYWRRIRPAVNHSSAIPARDPAAYARGRCLPRRTIGVEPGRRAAALHRRQRMVDQEVSDHGPAEGPADERHHRLSPGRPPLSQIESAKETGHYLQYCSPAQRDRPSATGRTRAIIGCSMLQPMIGKPNFLAPDGPTKGPGTTSTITGTEFLL